MSREKHGKLTPAGLELWQRSWRHRISKTKFYEFVRRRGEELSEHWWPPMYEGKVVPWKMFELLAAYLKKRGQDIELSAVAVEVDDPAEPIRQIQPWYFRLWFVLWNTLMSVLRQFQEDPDCRCKNRGDVELAARMIMEWLGRHNMDDPLTVTKEVAIANGKRVMYRSVDALTEQLYGYWNLQKDTIRFAVFKGERIGLLVTLPLRREVWRTFRSGAWFDAAITPDHLRMKSSHLLILFAAERVDDETPKRKHVSAMQTCCGHQLACLSPPIAWFIKKRNLHLLSIGGSPESMRALQGVGFIPTGTFLPKAEKPLYEMTPRSVRKAGLTMTYALLLAVVSFLQHINHAQKSEGNDSI
jgi:hypothetical protein